MWRSLSPKLTSLVRTEFFAEGVFLLGDYCLHTGWYLWKKLKYPYTITVLSCHVTRVLTLHLSSHSRTVAGCGPRWNPPQVWQSQHPGNRHTGLIPQIVTPSWGGWACRGGGREAREVRDAAESTSWKHLLDSTYRTCCRSIKIEQPDIQFRFNVFEISVLNSVLTYTCRCAVQLTYFSNGSYQDYTLSDRYVPERGRCRHGQTDWYWRRCC